MQKAIAVTKQETLLYALAAAGVVIVILLGTIVFLLSNRETSTGAGDIPSATGVPGAGAQQAPPLSPGQIENSGGSLPAGHVPVGQDPSAGGAAGEQGGAAPPAGTEGSETAPKSGEKGSGK